MAMARALVALLAHTAAAAAAGTTVLKSTQLTATLDSEHGLLELTAGVDSAPPHAFVPGSDSWKVELSAFNATTGAVSLSPHGGCTLSGFEPKPPSSATYTFACKAAAGVYRVEVEYELQEDWAFVRKHIRVCQSASGTTCTAWEGTVRSVQHWTGLTPTVGAAPGFASANPGNDDFHPKAAADEADQQDASSRTRLRAAPGPLQPLWIAGFWRRDVTRDGLFASVCNPYGVYDNATAQVTQLSAPTLAWEGDTFEVKPGHVCSGKNYEFIGGVPTVEACQAKCAADHNCAEFEYAAKNPDGKRWCDLFNASSITREPRPNPKFTCGCRGSCPTAPAPPGPHPSPPGPPHPSPPGPPHPGPAPVPPSAVLPAAIHARFDPIFLQTKNHEPMYAAEPAVLGITFLQKYDIDSVSGVNLGEQKAFTAAVAASLLDGGAARRPVRVQVGWDSNDYQIDVGTEAGRTEYKRMLARDASLGVTHAIYAPRNNLRSSRADVSDNWGWEEALWIELGEHIRELKWVPGKDEVPPEIAEMIKYGLDRGVKLMAYAYPVLPFMGDGAEPIDGEGWLYQQHNPHGQPMVNKKNCTLCEHRASLAHVGFQDYLAKTLSVFVNVTGIGGYAWDYTNYEDWRQPTSYAEWRGWMRVLDLLRADHPDIVMDHRQTSHIWGPWAHAAGSYTEPIAGDENPESYGAAGEGGVPTLSTDAVLANNMRRVNYVFRTRQLEANVRIPGFMMHQSERHFDNHCNITRGSLQGGGPSKCANPGHCACEGPNTGNFSSENARDFDYLGYRYGLLSSIGTAGLNNVLAMLPARDEDEFKLFPEEDVAWINKWLNFTDENFEALHETIQLAALDRGPELSAGKPRVGFLDGTASFLPDDSEGFLFLFNPGPRPVQAQLYVDEGMGISNSSSNSTFMVHEIYPREETDGRKTPIGLWQHGQQIDVSVSGHVQVLRVTKIEDPSTIELPIVFNVSYVSAETTIQPTGQAAHKSQVLTVTGARGLTGSNSLAVALTAVSPDASIRWNMQNPVVNGIAVITANKKPPCSELPAGLNAQCNTLLLHFEGSAMLRDMPEATTTSPPKNFSGGWFNSTLSTDPSMFEMLEAIHTSYPVPWQPEDMTAAWLGNRLMLYLYVTEPDVGATKPRLWLDGEEVTLTNAFNSRGNQQKKCYLGQYFDATQQASAAPSRTLSLWFPPLNQSEFLGLFWHGLRNQDTENLIGLPTIGNLSTECGKDESSMPPKPPATAKNVLYLLVDDLRPQLSIYGQKVMHTPNVEKLAKRGMVFDNAYCQIAVCSPSRMSFMSGRRPATSGTYNFVNHIRQAQCSSATARTAISAPSLFLRNVSVPMNMGGAGECCTQCTNDPACQAWTYFSGTQALRPKGPGAYICSLFSGPGVRSPAGLGVISGTKGVFDSAKWTAHPEHYRNSGYLTLQTGKTWHTEEGGLSAKSHGIGVGMPPAQDGFKSWSKGCGMYDVNAVASMANCDRCANLTVFDGHTNCMMAGSNGCPLSAATEEGVMTDPELAPLCDKTIADDAIAKLKLASAFKTQTGRPFFLNCGFRKPHMAWRYPAAFLKYYPDPSAIVTAAYPTMDATVPPIAHHTPDLQSQSGGNPYIPMNKTTAQWSRLSYYSAVSWMDSQLGRVLDELDAQKQTADTLIVMHSDHGWNLGEHGQWQKFTNWETGVRVPLVISAPWLSQSAGLRSASIVELVDIMPTTIDLAGLQPPEGETLDGTSLGELLRKPLAPTKSWDKVALSQYPRCPASKDGETWTTNTSLMWINNWCEFTDRVDIPWMGFSMRTSEYRYTEWAKWDGASQRADWDVLAGKELYSHTDVDNNDFDATENSNLAVNPSHAKTVERLSAQLHALVKAQEPPRV